VVVQHSPPPAMETPTVCPFAIDITPGSLPKKRLGKTWDWRGFLIFAVRCFLYSSLRTKYSQPGPQVQGQAYKVPFPVLQKHLHFFLTLLAKSNRKLSGGPWKEIILPPLCTVSDFESHELPALYRILGLGTPHCICGGMGRCSSHR
jgi:hypothetical protein